MPKTLRSLFVLTALATLILSYQNCGKMSAASIGGVTATNSIEGFVSTPEDFIGMKDGETYELTQDVDLGGQIVRRSFTGVTLIGHGHTISGILAQCPQPNDCKVNSGRDFYISSLDFIESDVSNINFSSSADVSKFPSVNDDITALNFVNFQSSKVSKVSFSNTLSGVHTHQSGDRRFFVSGFSAYDSTLTDVSVKIEGEVSINAAMFVGFSTMGEVWGSTLTRVDAQSNVRWNPLVAGSNFYYDAVSSINQGTIIDSTIDDKFSISGTRANFTSSVIGTGVPMGKMLNSQIRTQSNFTPNTLELIQNQNHSSYPFDKTGTVHTHTVVP